MRRAVLAYSRRVVKSRHVFIQHARAMPFRLQSVTRGAGLQDSRRFCVDRDLAKVNSELGTGAGSAGPAPGARRLSRTPAAFSGKFSGKISGTVFR